MRRIALVIVLGIVAAVGMCARVASAAWMGVLVPAYANPASPGGPNMWSSLIATAGSPARQFELRAIFNPASGPGASREPNYLTAGGTGPLNDFRVAGGLADGYVPTKELSGGSLVLRPLDEVKADVDAYLTGIYAGFVDGIFFDDMSNDLADVGFYQSLQAYVKSIKSDAHTFGNPGTTFVNNPSGQVQFDANNFIHALDTVVVFENTKSEYLNNYTSFPHLQGLSPQSLAHIVHTSSPWDPAIISLAASRGAGYLYVTDDIMPNPYDELTGDWGQFTADVSSFNQTSVPEPTSWLAFAGLTVLLIARRSAHGSFSR